MVEATKAPEKKKRQARAAPAPAPAAAPAPVRSFTIDVAALRAAMADVLGAIESKNTIPILAHVLIECRGSALSLTGTDLDRWVTREVAVDRPDRARDFVLALPAHALARVLKALPGESELELIAPAGDEQQAVIRSGRAVVKMAVLPVEDFPAVPQSDAGLPGGFEIHASELADALAAVSHAISSEETRYYLNGVFVHPLEHPAGDQLRFAATDGARLARVALDQPEGAADVPAAIWPRDLVTQLTGLCEKAVKAAKATDDPPMVLVQLHNPDGSRLAFDLPAGDGGTVQVVAKMVDGTFPDYARVIPTNNPGTLICDKADLERAVRFVAALASDKTRAVRLEMGPSSLMLSVLTPDLGEARETIPAALLGDPQEIGFDAGRLLAALGALAAEQVQLSFADGTGPVLISGPDPDSATDRLVQVVMPMRV